MSGFVEVPRDEDSEDDSDDEENKAGDSESPEGIIAKAKEEAAKTGDEEDPGAKEDTGTKEDNKDDVLDKKNDDEKEEVVEEKFYDKTTILIDNFDMARTNMNGKLVFLVICQISLIYLLVIE